ncbi:MAG: pentapeptide repeat-containing protein [Candidatus Marinimicrobia bacterium]|nr:pentapeptide repeat-containing protein [Candidatus Neomarinimicrobiota bacterium]
MSPNLEHIKKLKSGSKTWNQWRVQNSQVTPDLHKLNFYSDLHPKSNRYIFPEYTSYNFSGCNLNGASMRNCVFTKCDFSNSSIHFSDLVEAHFSSCNFKNCGIRLSKIGSAIFTNCDFEGADLSYSGAEETKIINSYLFMTDLSHMRLVKTDFTNSKIINSRVYGISSWELVLEGSVQSNIYIEEEGSRITVPNIELAQFISLMVNNSKIRDIIDTITSKVVLILGRFTPERKSILDMIKENLQTKDYVPIIFDFVGPSSREITETVVSLAAMSRFVIADISNPKSIPQELMSIIPNFPSLKVQPIIEKSQKEYEMFEYFKNYPWVLNTIKYSKGSLNELINKIIMNCEG